MVEGDVSVLKHEDEEGTKTSFNIIQRELSLRSHEMNWTSLTQCAQVVSKFLGGHESRTRRTRWTGSRTRSSNKLVPIEVCPLIRNLANFQPVGLHG